MKTKEELANTRSFVILLGAMLALGPMSIDLYLPAMADMARHFEASMAAAGLTMSGYFFGAAIGQFLGGGLSDQLGRRRVMAAGLMAFILASTLITVATRIEHVQALRLLQGLGGGSISVVCLATIRDVYPPHEVARRFATAALIMLQAPLVAPLMGAFLAQFGWHYAFVFLASYGLLVASLYAWRLPETLNAPPSQFSWRELVVGYRTVWKRENKGRYIARYFLLYAAFNSGVFICYVTNASAIYMRHFGLSSVQFGILFSLNALMMMTGNRAAHHLLLRIKPIKLVRTANGTQLAVMTLIILGMLLGLDNPWLLASVMLLVVVSAGTVGPTMSGTLISYFDRNSGSAASLNSTVFMLGGGLIGGLAGLSAQAFGNSILPIFVVIFSSIAAGQLTLRQLDMIVD